MASSPPPDFVPRAVTRTPARPSTARPPALG
ncbi:MAG: hypothetical protein JWO86_5731, partial [Myxococcaceae bacterium]|nr:hypothetical protein [Myxococcaceae bacterium]